MYFGKKVHILSYALLLSSIVNICASAASGGLRFLLRDDLTHVPDMLNVMFANISLMVNIIQVIVITIIFFVQYRKLSRYTSLIDNSDIEEIGKLQEELLGENKSTLPVSSIKRLFVIWAAIMILAEAIFNMTSSFYSRMIAEVTAIVTQAYGTVPDAFVSLYNNTHGFKYIGMLIMIATGIFVTGVFLDDVMLIGGSGVLLVLFLTAFANAGMTMIVVFGKVIGIVWTSFISHTLETVGLMVFAIYIGKRYNGL